MDNFLNIKNLEENILSLKRINFHSFTLGHLANFSNLFHNLGSQSYEIEKEFGARVDIRTVAPQSFVMINTIIYEYLNTTSKYHSDVLELKLPMNSYMNDSLLPSTLNKKCTYQTLSNAFNIPIETIRRHCKPWLKSGIMLKSKERGLFTDLNLVINSNLFRKSHYQIANSMIENWKIIISNLNDLDFIKNKIYFNPRPINKISRNNYVKIIINLNFFWFKSLIFQMNSHLTFFELCILSSSLYFKDKKKVLYMNTKDFDYYKSGILIPTNINSISNATLIPRETTRRTVHQLIKKGLLKKQGNSIFISENVLNGNTDRLINKKLKEKVVRDSMIVLETFNEALN